MLKQVKDLEWNNNNLILERKLFGANKESLKKKITEVMENISDRDIETYFFDYLDGFIGDNMYVDENYIVYKLTQI